MLAARQAPPALTQARISHQVALGRLRNLLENHQCDGSLTITGDEQGVIQSNGP